MNINSKSHYIEISEEEDPTSSLEKADQSQKHCFIIELSAFFRALRKKPLKMINFLKDNIIDKKLLLTVECGDYDNKIIIKNTLSKALNQYKDKFSNDQKIEGIKDRLLVCCCKYRLK